MCCFLLSFCSQGDVWHACPPAMHIPPGHACPLPCTPPAMHGLGMHAPLPHMPSCHACPPCHTCPLPCMPPVMHAPLPCMPPQWILRDAVNERAVRIVIECILVSNNNTLCSKIRLVTEIFIPNYQSFFFKSTQLGELSQKSFRKP